MSWILDQVITTHLCSIFLEYRCNHAKHISTTKTKQEHISKLSSSPFPRVKNETQDKSWVPAPASPAIPTSGATSMTARAGRRARGPST
ncbi:hypothetical protein CCHR01_03451 [Colletotrichum chrysophilum]|uniref:Uncharacterized protein n=1 Tax=Colletotrichum chrysophilum TaxID=1836956 RepID=A0AAD9ASZ1_9PEZI|nr:hypothetical protein CCHR01_03451 [Colletotrichum chrysophilum]